MVFHARKWHVLACQLIEAVKPELISERSAYPFIPSGSACEVMLSSSPVPDIVAIARDRLPEQDGPFQGAPDWLIEIRSPDQSTLTLQAQILHCLQNGTQLAWVIDLDRQQIWVWEGDDLPNIYTGGDRLPMPGFDLSLTAAEIFALAHQRR